MKKKTIITAAIVFVLILSLASAINWKKMRPEGKVVYAKGKSIVILDLSTGKSRTIRTKTQGVYVPCLSPDEKMIAFEEHRPRIYLINVDSTGLRQLTKGNDDGHDHDPSWSPDSKRIAFHRGGPDEISGIYIINADGTNEIRLMADTNEVTYSYPSWSPDGKKIAYIKDSRAICTVSPDGMDKTLLIQGKDNIESLSWSPDAKKIVYSSGGYVQDIYVMNADGTNIKRLTFIPKSTFTNTAYYPIWTPDGKKIIYQVFSRFGGLWCRKRYYIMNPDGSSQEKLLSVFVFGS